MKGRLKDGGPPLTPPDAFNRRGCTKPSQELGPQSGSLYGWLGPKCLSFYLLLPRVCVSISCVRSRVARIQTGAKMRYSPRQCLNSLHQLSALAAAFFFFFLIPMWSLLCKVLCYIQISSIVVPAPSVPGMPEIERHLCFCSNFLLMYLWDNSWWPKYLGPLSRNGGSLWSPGCWHLPGSASSAIGIGGEPPDGRTSLTFYVTAFKWTNCVCLQWYRRVGCSEPVKQGLSSSSPVCMLILCLTWLLVIHHLITLPLVKVFLTSCIMALLEV